MSPDEQLRNALQAILDSYDDAGWTLSHFVIPMGLERIRDGVIENTVWMYVPPFQPDYVADGLLYRADELQHAEADIEDD